jgi:putative transport protein
MSDWICIIIVIAVMVLILSRRKGTTLNTSINNQVKGGVNMALHEKDKVGDNMNIETFTRICRRYSTALLRVAAALIAILILESVLGTVSAWAADAQAPLSNYWVVQMLHKYPELTIFLVLSMGYWLGKLKIGKFSLGTVTGVLVAGILIGQLQIQISGPIKSMFFLFFLFSVGYGVGPQFVRGVAKSGAPQLIFGVIVCVLCLLSVYFVCIVMGYDAGFGAGLIAGAMTISAAMGLATDSINQLGLSPEKTKEMLDHIPVAYAITYIWGTVGTGIILAKLGPKILRVNLAEECKKLEKEMSVGTPDGGLQSAWRQYGLRAYEILPDGIALGKSVADIENLFPGKRVFVDRIRRGGKIIDAAPTTTLQAGDIVAVSGPTEVLAETIGKRGTEKADRELLDIPVEAVDVVVTSKAFNGKTLIELAKEEFTRGTYLRKITRGSVSAEIPVLAQTEIYRADILRIVGARKNTDRFVKAIGYADRPADMTDMIWVGLAVVIGGLIGAVVIPMGGVPVTLSTSGGALIGGLVLGWARGVHPTFGRVPAPSLWFMQSVGLNVFIAIVGLSTGPGFIKGVVNNGVALFLWGLFATSVPMILGMLIGKYIFKFPAPINLGCCGGARTSTASVQMVGDEAGGSNIPMLGYTVPYAIGNTLLTLWGMVIVLMMGAPK